MKIFSSRDARVKEEAIIARPFFAGGRRTDFRGRGSFSGPRINERIRVPRVRVIAADGEQLGIMAPLDAYKIAVEQGYDLVEISPTADPPVCKIMDYGKYKYEEQKKKQESKKKQIVVTVKEIKLRPNIDTHDYDFKMKHIRRFLAQKDKAKVTMQFRGREMMYVDRGKAVLNKIIKDVEDLGAPEKAPKMEGRSLSVIVQPK